MPSKRSDMRQQPPATQPTHRPADGYQLLIQLLARQAVDEHIAALDKTQSQEQRSKT